MPLSAHFTHVTLLHYISKNWADQSWAPLKHILKVKKKKEKGENLLYFFFFEK